MCYIYQLVNALFHLDIDFGYAKPDLYHCLLATVLMSLKSMISNYQMSNIMVALLVKTARSFEFSLTDLRNFGAYSNSRREPFHPQEWRKEYTMCTQTLCTHGLGLVDAQISEQCEMCWLL